MLMYIDFIDMVAMVSVMHGTNTPDLDSVF